VSAGPRSLVVTVVLALAACAARPPPQAAADPSASLAPTDLAGSEWTLASFDGAPVLPGHGITLHFEADRVGGHTGCNAYGAAWVVADGQLDIASIEQTAAACADPAASDQEAHYLERLRSGPRLVPGGVRLRLDGPRPGQRLDFVRRRVAAMDPAALPGSRWRLREAVVATRPIRIAFEAARIVGFAGCRDFESDYTARGDAIFVSATRMSALDCPDGEAAIVREGDFTTDLGSAAYWRIDGDTLVLTTPGGRERRFERERGPAR
jgi:heat shock protein HslJ